MNSLAVEEYMNGRAGVSARERQDESTNASK